MLKTITENALSQEGMTQNYQDTNFKKKITRERQNIGANDVQLLKARLLKCICILRKVWIKPA